MSESSPMRREPALEVVLSHVERAFCPWCRWSGLLAAYCRAPPKRKPNGELCATDIVNPYGRCDAYTLSLGTRVLRKLGRRLPVLIEAKP